MKPKLAKNRSPRPSRKQGTKWSRRRSAGATARAIIARLKAHANPDNVAGMARFGINPRNTLGVSIPLLRRIAREHGRDHAVAALLWQSGIHEARILASMIDEPARLTGPQMDRWARGFDSWDVCDQCCANLFEDSPLAWKKALAWSKSEREYVKRAGFTLMARLAVASQRAPDTAFGRFFPRIERESSDDRPMVRKAVNWALRQIGKRDMALHHAALALAERLRNRTDRAARWIGSDAVRELRGRTALGIIKRHERRKATYRN